MITYLYWALVIALVIAAMAVLAGKMNNIRAALIASVAILAAGWGAFHFHFEQLFVKRFGGVMSISVPDGQHHIAATWKDDHLWVQNYDPATNTCIFSEYARGNVLEGRVLIKNCNPLLPRLPAPPVPPAGAPAAPAAPAN